MLKFFFVSIKLYCKKVVDIISSNLSTNFVFDVILNGCKALLMNHKNFKICFIRKQANNIVHLLTEASLMLVSKFI